MTIVDGGPVNTDPDLEFSQDMYRPLSPAEILDNLSSWLHSALGCDPYAADTAEQFEANLVRRDCLLDTLNWLKRLGAEEWV